MTAYDDLKTRLQAEPRTWLVTGVAGFIGSNLLETLLKLDQRVVGLDNFATGHQRNLDEVQGLVTPAQWDRFRFIEGDICNLEDCHRALGVLPPLPRAGEGRGEGKEARRSDGLPPALHPLPLVGEGRGEGIPVDYILHQAALGSVPRSLEDPLTTHATNCTGHLNMLVAARDARVKRFVYAASSSTYGDHPGLPKVEDVIGKPLSPYAVTKYVNELYADVFARSYGLQSLGLRYFNVFGPRQDPNGAYAAVIPKWIASLLKGDPVHINGDGETSRDFCFIANVVQANLLAATAPVFLSPPALPPLPRVGEGRGEGDVLPEGLPLSQIFNIAVGDRTTLNQLFTLLLQNLAPHGVPPDTQPIHRAFRPGDVRHSLADISKAAALLGYAPTQRIGEGLALAMPWYLNVK